MKVEFHSSRFVCCSLNGIRKPYIIYALFFAAFFTPFSECQRQANFSSTGPTNDTQQKTEVIGSHKILSLNRSEDYYDDYNEGQNSTGNWQEYDTEENSKFAQVAVYMFVILFALFGILIKYFVTQYETSQIEAQEQMHYHRLHNQVA